MIEIVNSFWAIFLIINYYAYWADLKDGFERKYFTNQKKCDKIKACKAIN